MKTAIENAIAAERFSMSALRSAAWPLLTKHPTICNYSPKLVTHFSTTLANLANAIFRHVFLIEIVKTPKIETTKFQCRWFAELLDNNDPRYCSFDECLEIAGDLFQELCDTWLTTPDHATAVKLCFSNSQLPYEVPLDYAERPLPDQPGVRIHRRGNLKWTCTDTMLRTLKLRQFLTESPKSPDRKFFKEVLDGKIQVKTYLTDRVLTGSYKTNREKRWEVHPYSVHFALRRTCMEIEYALIQQICAFHGFPEESKVILQNEGILARNLSEYRCPVTLDRMSFDAFRAEVSNPLHGKANFQVGHLNPLKLDDPTAAASGHTAQNIGWVSADGNRVQGSMGIAEVRTMIRRIAKNYEEMGLV